MSELTERELRFLHESNAIEDIRNIDYRVEARVGAGHVGAYLAAQEKARAREPLTLSDLCIWQRWLMEEQGGFGHDVPKDGAGALRSPAYPVNVRVGMHFPPDYGQVPSLLEAWLCDLNERVRTKYPFIEDADAADLLGEFFQRFEAIHPFADGNGRTGRLIANYLATIAETPIIVFRADERPAFYAAHRSKMAMRVFMAEKIREAIYSPGGTVLERRTQETTQDRFDGVVVKRHALVEKVREWTRADESDK